MAPKGAGHPRKAEAMEREAAKKAEKNRVEQERAEGAKWADDGDKAARAREARAREADAKVEEKRRRDAEKRDLLKLEEEGAARKIAPAKKVNVADIRVSALLSMNTKGAAPTKAPVVLVGEQPLAPNPNRVAQLEALRTGVETASATGVDEAIAVTRGDSAAVDLHPERRMKALHAAFEERRMAELRAERPGLKRSQLKEIIWKEWQKSPENPLLPTQP